ncbi:ThiF family adenylyltransferase, partial [Streptomyces sparsus]
SPASSMRLRPKRSAALPAAGVGQVDVVDGGCVEAWDTTPAGVDAEQVGERRSTALGRMVRRASPWPRVPAQREAERGPGLVVLAPRDGLAAYAPDPAEARELVATGRPHLYAGVVEGTGFVGPLVLPGSSACGECMLLGRAEREPTWPLAVGQWRSARRSGVPACDVALATVVAGAAACQALGFLDGDFPDDDAADSETADGDAAAGECAAGIRTSFVLPWLRKEEELMEPYRECPCGAAGAAPAPGATGMGSRQVTMAS